MKVETTPPEKGASVGSQAGVTIDPMWDDARSVGKFVQIRMLEPWDTDQVSLGGQVYIDIHRLGLVGLVACPNVS
jgi:hypothetical protein